MIGWLRKKADQWLRKELDRCLMDRAFRTLHEKIEDQDKQIRTLLAARDKVINHTKQQTAIVQVVKKDKQSTRDELQRQIKANQRNKIKYHIENERQDAIIKQLCDLVDKETFRKICADIRGRPDSEFLPEKWRSSDDQSPPED